MSLKGFIDEENDKLFERLLAASLRMSQLIKDLLSYSKVSAQAVEFKPVSLGNIVNGVIIDLEAAIAENKASLTVGPLPVIPGDPVQLQQLFQNLISNALKYKKMESLRL